MHYIIDEESYTSLMDWGKDNPDIINRSKIFEQYYENKSTITLVKMIEGKYDVEAYIKVTTQAVKIELKSRGKQILKFKIAQATDSVDDDFFISASEEVKQNDNMRETTEIVSRIFIIINMFMLYGNIVDYDDRKLSGQKQKGNIVFRPFKGTIYAVNIGDRVRKSPEGIFEVRGHLRHYKSGKLVWIEPFLKGVKDDDKPKI